MFKSLGALLGGIFVGAVGVEIVRKKYPDALNQFYSRTREIASEAKEAFKSGYHNAVKPKDAVAPA